MEQAIDAFPDYLVEAQGLCRNFSPSTAASAEINKVVVLGMGGSAIGGELLKSLAEKSSPIPVLVIRDEVIPEYVDKKTLVLAVSYSGNTQETLLSLRAALKKTDRRIIVISTGGTLNELAAREGFPHLKIPGGLMPRAALPFTFVPLVYILQKINLLPDQSKALEEAIQILKRMRKEKDEAARIAKRLHGQLPVIYASSPFFSACACRWKCQINENAKQPAFFGSFPEVAHNEIVAYTHHLPIHDLLSVIFLRDPDESEAIQKRVEFTKKIVLDAGSIIYEFFSQGKSFLAKLLSLCYFGDQVSLYLAKENGVDPVQIEVIQQLKEVLK